jgi:hypothetical protein
MTQKNGQEPENLKWMEIAESDAINEVRHSRGRLPFVVAAIALVAVGGGALFAQTDNPAPFQVQPSSVVTAVATALPTTGQQVTSQQATLTPPVVSTGIPTIAPVAGGGYNGDDGDDYDDDDDDDDEEGEDDEEDEEDDD